MDHTLFDMLHDRAAKFNQDVVRGLATKHVAEVEAYLDRSLRSASQGFPPALKYHGIQRCTPEEEYRVATKRLTNSQTTLELAPSDVYLVKFLFTFNDEPVDPPCYVELPFVRQAGLMRIRGSIFAISPVLIDPAISVGMDSIFIPLGRAKLTFKREMHHMQVDGARESVYIYYSRMHNLNEKMRADQKKRTVVGETSLAHYLFAKLGLRQTFQQYFNTDIVVGDNKTITPELYPESEWVICSSVTENGMFKPRGVKEKLYPGTRVRIAVPRKDWNLTVAAVVGGFFYIADHFPERVLPEYINDADVEDEKRLWQTLLGLFLVGAPQGEGKLLEDIRNHMTSLDGYVDFEAKKDLQNVDVFVEDVYDLLMHIIETFSSRVTHYGVNVSSMYDKRLVILRYLLHEIVRGINTFMFKVSGDKRKVLTKKEVQSLLRFNIKPKQIVKINRGHGEVSPISAPSDNMYFKITSNLVAQADSSKSASKTKSNPTDPSKFLHVSIAEVGSFNAVSKSEPTGRSKINPHVNLTPDAMIQRDPRKAEFLDWVQRRLGP